MRIVNIIKDLLHLFYPQLCGACKKSLFKHESELCSICVKTLPYTKFSPNHKASLERIFWGRVPMQFVYSLLYFDKRSRVQNILHALKYKGRAALGVRLGELMKEDLLQFHAQYPIDEIIPVPLHKRRLEERGYNQAEMIGRGIAQTTKIPLNENRLERARYTQTQTKFSREKRSENLKNVFRVNAPHELKGKHILLIDDVLTTGSTLEACSEALLKEIDVKISVAVVAFA